MDNLIKYSVQSDQFIKLSQEWKSFLDQNFQTQSEINIIFDSEIPTIIDSENRKLRIDFQNDHLNYKKKKAGLQTEPISRALGAGKKGLRVLDLSAGMGIDAVFLAQMGYQVTAIERNPLLYLALTQALKNSTDNLKLNFQFADSHFFLKQTTDSYDVCYFDPMFPQKKKTALPKQEMVFFKNLVGGDVDASQVLSAAMESKKFKRCVVKRPLAAPELLPASGTVQGKIIRYDIYGGIE